MNRWLVTLAVAFLPSQAIGAPVFYVTGPYLGLADSPFDTSGLGTTFFVEDFEDGSLDLPGLVVNQGGPLQTTVLGPGNGAVSVEGGAAGHALKSINNFRQLTIPPVDYSGLTLEFSPIAGALPTHVGFVLTNLDATSDQLGMRTNVYGPAGELLGTAVSERFELTERPFFGVAATEGISRIDFDVIVIDDQPYFQVDHLQFAVPEPATVFLGLLGVTCLIARSIWRARRPQHLKSFACSQRRGRASGKLQKEDLYNAVLPNPAQGLRLRVPRHRVAPRDSVAV